MALVVKNLPSNAGDARDEGSIPWRRAWQAFLPGKSHGWRSLVGYSSWGCKEYWSGLPFPSPGNLPNLGIKTRSPTLQEDSLPSEPRETAKMAFSSPSSGPEG